MTLAPTHPTMAIDYEAVLKSLNLNPADPKTQALMLVCDRYGLDPVLKHIVLISGNAYVTRDGYLAVAHRSGQFDGMEVLDQGADSTHYTAKVAVYRKDMSHPFTFVGRYPKSKNMAKEYGPEMAVKVAEVQGLRRAFNVTGLGASDERWDDAAIDVEVAEVLDPPDPEITEAKKALGELIGEFPPDEQLTIKSHLRGRFGESKDMNLTTVQQAVTVVAGWPDSAVIEEVPDGVSF